MVPIHLLILKQVQILNIIWYIEGNTWQFPFIVPHDVLSLMRKASKKLDLLFDGGHFDMANEPDIAFLYIFNELDHNPRKASQLVQDLIKNHFKMFPEVFQAMMIQVL